MSVSFIRIDDRMIHGQTCTRWAREYPCDGLVAVNDKAADNSVLKAAYKAASGKKTFVWTVDAFAKKSQKVLDSDTQYFLITKNPIDMATILVDQGFKCGIDTVIVGPCNDREGAVKLVITSLLLRKKQTHSKEFLKQVIKSNLPYYQMYQLVHGMTSKVNSVINKYNI